MLLGVWAAQWFAYFVVYIIAVSLFLSGSPNLRTAITLVDIQLTISLVMTPLFVAFLVWHSTKSVMTPSDTLNARPTSPAPGLGMAAVAAIVYAALCTIGPVMSFALNAPIIINGPWLIILATAALSMIETVWRPLSDPSSA